MKEIEDYEKYIDDDGGYCYNDIDAKHNELYYKLYIRYKEQIGQKTHNTNSQSLEKIKILCEKVDDFNRTIDNEKAYSCNEFYDKLNKM